MSLEASAMAQMQGFVRCKNTFIVGMPVTGAVMMPLTTSHPESVGICCENCSQERLSASQTVVGLNAVGMQEGLICHSWKACVLEGAPFPLAAYPQIFAKCAARNVSMQAARQFLHRPFGASATIEPWQGMSPRHHLEGANAMNQPNSQRNPNQVNQQQSGQKPGAPKEQQHQQQSPQQKQPGQQDRSQQQR